jgi:hypothetical protein
LEDDDFGALSSVPISAWSIVGGRRRISFAETEPSTR